jgi:sugar transferase (PEP-CTERM system associated)
MIRLFRVFIPTSVVGLLLTEIPLAFLCYVFAYWVIGDGSVGIFYPYENGYIRTGIVVGAVALGLYFNDLYSDLRVLSRIRLLQQFCLALGIAFMAQAFLSYFLRSLTVPRWNMMLGSAFVLIVLPSWRMAYARFSLEVFGRQKILFVGCNSEVVSICTALRQRPEFGLSVLGFLSEEDADDPPCGCDCERLGQASDLLTVWSKLRPDRLVVGLHERRNRMPVYDLLDLRLKGAIIEDAASLYESVTGRVPVSALRPSSLVFADELGPDRTYTAIQRFYSFLIALFGTILVAPIMLAVAILVKTTSPGPVLYRQRRVGREGRVFEVLKFRSMYVDAEARTGAVWATKNDPRITPLGRWIRKLRFDEFPQFFNVLKGDMSIVGPRPERPEFVEILSREIPFYGQRHAILPGVTGWAQISHKYGDTIEDTVAKLEFDLYYLKNMSVSLDFYIIFHTIKVMLLHRGAQ